MTIEQELRVEKFRSIPRKTTLNIMYTGYWLISQVNRVLKPLGLTEPQFNVLTLVYAAMGKPVSSKAIQDGMIQTESNVTRIVDKLVSRGLARRRTCPENRRKVDITITEDGRKLFLRANSKVKALLKKLMNGIPEEDLELISDGLDRLRTGSNEKETGVGRQ